MFFNADLSGFVQPQINTSIRKGPYMYYPGNNSNAIVVLWQLKTSVPCTLKWGPDSTCSVGSETVMPYDSSTLQYKYMITSLLPNTKYFYSLAINGVTIVNTFVTNPPNADADVDFLLFADIQDSGSTFNTTCGNILNYLKANPSTQTIAFQLGDSVGGDGTKESDWDNIVFGNSGQYSNVTKFLASVPMNTVRGNHNDTILYPRYFPSPNASKLWYGFDYGQIHFIVIDTESSYSPGSEQYTFIESQLSTNNETWKIPLFHRPGWSSGDNESQVNVQKYLHPLFVKYGVKVVYMGHNHHFSQMIVDGINYLTVGPVGASTKPITQNQSMIIKSYVIRHFNRIQISGNTLKHTIIHADTGAIVDTLTLTR